LLTTFIELHVRTLDTRQQYVACGPKVVHAVCSMGNF